MVAMARAVMCLSLWLAVCQVRGAYVSQKMNRTIQNLLQYYEITKEEGFDGKPVFSTEPLSGKTETKMLFLCSVLETYEKLIGHMLKQVATPMPQAATAADAELAADRDVKMELSFILKEVQRLRERRCEEQKDVLQGLQALRHIQMDNLVVQSKALWELLWFYEEASSLSDNIKMRRRRRRRRQAQRVKTHLRA